MRQAPSAYAALRIALVLQQEPLKSAAWRTALALQQAPVLKDPPHAKAAQLGWAGLPVCRPIGCYSPTRYLESTDHIPPMCCLLRDVASAGLRLAAVDG